MAKYTMELRKLCEIFGKQEVENWFKSYNLEDFLTPSQIEILLKDNVWSKDKLAKKIVNHYYMREIGFETPALFKHYAQTTMEEIMEEYLLKIYTKFLEYDPLSSVDYVETFEREINTEDEGKLTTNNSSSLQGSSSSTNSSSLITDNEINQSTQTTVNNSNSSLEVNSDTPQTNISKQNLLNGSYASSTSARENSETNNTTSTTNTTNNTSSSENGNISSTNSENGSNNSVSNNNAKSKTLEKYTHKMVGDNGVIVTNQYLVREFRELAISLDLEIINKLNTLFMGVY